MVSFPLHGTSSFFTEPTTGMKLAKVISNILGTRSLQQTSGITVERILPMGPKQLTPIYSLSLIATYKPTGNPSLPLDVHGHFSFKLLLPSPNKSYTANRDRLTMVEDGQYRTIFKPPTRLWVKYIPLSHFIPMWMLVLSTFLLDISLTFQTSSGTCRLVDILNPFQASSEGTWKRYHSIYRPSANVPGKKLPKRWKSQIVGVSHISTYHIDTFSVPIFEQRNSTTVYFHIFWDCTSLHHYESPCITSA